MTSYTDTARRRARPGLGTFERYLTLWVALCIIVGVALLFWLIAPLVGIFS